MTMFILNINRTKFLLLIVLLGTLLRLILHNMIAIYPQGGDSIYYTEVARNIAEFGVHKSKDSFYYRVPLYPFFISFFHINGQIAILPVIVFQNIIGIAVSILIYFSVSKINEHLARYACLITCLLPGFVLMEYRILSEVISSSVFLFGATLLFGVYRRHLIENAVFGGILLALSALLTQTLMLYGVFFATVVCIYDRKLHRECILAAIISIATLVPWAVRNNLIAGEGYFLSKGTFGFNLWVGTWETGENWMVDGIPAHAYRSQVERSELSSEGQRSDRFGTIARERIKSQPLETLTIWLRRAPHQWFGTRSDLNKFYLQRHSLAWYIWKSLLWGINTLFILLCILGIVMNWQKQLITYVFLFPVVYIALVYFPFHNSETRYSTAALPFMAIFSAIPLCVLYEKVRWRWIGNNGCRNRRSP